MDYAIGCELAREYNLEWAFVQLWSDSVDYHGIDDVGAVEDALEILGIL